MALLQEAPLIWGRSASRRIRVILHDSKIFVLTKRSLFRQFQRPSSIFFALLAMLFILIGLCYVHSLLLVHLDQAALPVKRAAGALLGLSDPAFNTAALYIRHISLTNISTPFQECPGCFDYFPGCYAFNPPLFSGIETSFERR